MRIYEKIKSLIFEKNQVTVRIPQEVVALLDMKKGDGMLFQIKTKRRSKSLIIQWIPTIRKEVDDNAHNTTKKDY